MKRYYVLCIMPARSADINVKDFSEKISITKLSKQ